MRLPRAAHYSRPWRIHELTGDFRLEDLWALPAEGDADDFPRLVGILTSSEGLGGSSGASRALVAIRKGLGELLGWERPGGGLGSRVRTLRERLPADLRDAPPGPRLSGAPLDSVYMLADEWAAELANRTVHAVLHVGWVPTGDGRYRGQMAILVKPNGLLGSAYMAAIRPARRLVVYPAMVRRIGRAWPGPWARARPGQP